MFWLLLLCIHQSWIILANAVGRLGAVRSLFDEKYGFTLTILKFSF
ncbi:MAG: hypothetical protein AAGF83_26715 [Cyanobacteria bacterium P01_G01_bin.67]